MEVNECCKAVAKLITDKLTEVDVIVSVVQGSDGKEIRLYTPKGRAIGNKSMTLADTEDMFNKTITSKVTINLNLLVRNE